jgi:hypothetical protein
MIKKEVKKMTRKEVEKFAIANWVQLYPIGSGHHNGSFTLEQIGKRRWITKNKKGKIFYLLE